MTRRFLLCIEANSVEEASEAFNQLLRLPRPIRGEVEIHVVDVTDQTHRVTPAPEVEAISGGG